MGSPLVVKLPNETGVYTLEVADQQNDETGTYRVTLEFVSGTAHDGSGLTTTGNYDVTVSGCP